MLIFFVKKRMIIYNSFVAHFIWKLFTFTSIVLSDAFVEEILSHVRDSIMTDVFFLLHNYNFRSSCNNSVAYKCYFLHIMCDVSFLRIFLCEHFKLFQFIKCHKVLLSSFNFQRWYPYRENGTFLKIET